MMTETIKKFIFIIACLLVWVVVIDCAIFGIVSFIFQFNHDDLTVVQVFKQFCPVWRNITIGGIVYLVIFRIWFSIKGEH